MIVFQRADRPYRKAVVTGAPRDAVLHKHVLVRSVYIDPLCKILNKKPAEEEISLLPLRLPRCRWPAAHAQ